MDLHYKQELKVGFLVLFALALLIAGLLWLSGRSFGGRMVTFQARLESIQGLTGGDEVHISGVRVGRVAGIAIEEVGKVLIRLEVDRRFRPKADAQVAVKALDFLGAKFIDYQPGTASDLLPDGAIVTGAQETDLATYATGLIDDFSSLAVRGRLFLSDSMARQTRATLEAAERALDVMARAGQGGLMDQATRAATTLQRAASRLDSILANRAIQTSVSQLDEITTSVQEMTDGLAVVTTSLGAVLQKIERGEGSIGKAVNDSTLHNDLHEVLQSLKALLDDIRENPGRYGPRNLKIF